MTTLSTVLFLSHTTEVMDFGVPSKLVASKRSPLSIPCQAPAKMQWKLTAENRRSVPLVKAKTTNVNGAPPQGKYKDDTSGKKKVIFVMGATATGKTKVSVDLATHVGAEIINSDKIQVYKGLNIASNKATEAERKGVPHHLLAVVEDPDADFSVHDFREQVHNALDHIYDNGSIPIIVGGSNNYVEGLVEDPSYAFREKFDSCFIWMDVSRPVHYNYVGKRVDQMVEAGLVDEIREMFFTDFPTDFSRGIWRTIGVPEMAKYFILETNTGDEWTKRVLLEKAIEEIKANTRKLVDSQLRKIRKLRNELGWKMHRIDATAVFEKREKGVDQGEWKKVVLNPSLEIVENFVANDNGGGQYGRVVIQDFERANAISL